MKKMKTEHTVLETKGYTSPAYRPAGPGEVWGDDYTGENSGAHGNIVVTEERRSDGRRRLVAINGRHREVGPWGPTRAQRKAKAATK